MAEVDAAEAVMNTLGHIVFFADAVSTSLASSYALKD